MELCRTPKLDNFTTKNPKRISLIKTPVECNALIILKLRLLSSKFFLLFRLQLLTREYRLQRISPSRWRLPHGSDFVPDTTGYEPKPQHSGNSSAGKICVNVY